jgi:formylglycine-generating enzyme required for sulfatase activity
MSHGFHLATLASWLPFVVMSCAGASAPAAQEVSAAATEEADVAPLPVAPELAPSAPAPPVELAPPPLTAPDGTVIKDCGPAPKGMVCVPGGSFLRGTDEGPEDTRPAATVWMQTYYMDIYEVTYAAYKACQKAKDCARAGPLYNDFSRPAQPMTGTDWHESVKFCEVMGKHLPTEAEWEKAARGPEGKLHPWGDEPATCERAVIKDARGRSCGVKKRMEHPNKGRTFVVGSRPPGVYGLYDMSGNAWEWVADWHSRDYADCGEACLGTDPKGPCAGAAACAGHDKKSVRGGSWYWVARYATGAYRRSHFPGNDPFHHFGFRCAATLAQGAALVERAGEAAPVTPAEGGASN